MASGSDELRVRFTRSGGLFGQPLPPVELSGRELSDEEAAALAEASNSGVLERELRPSGFATRGDEYQYDLVVRRGDEERTLRFTEFDVPPELEGLVALLERRADEAARGGGGGDDPAAA